MGRISAGVGLISGLNIDDIVGRLIAIEARPIQQIEVRISTQTAQQKALSELSAKLLSLQLTASTLSSASIFSSRSASSSNPSAVTATASADAVLGTYQVRPLRLARAQQYVSTGLSTSDSTPVGAGTVTVKLGGFVNSTTSLAQLNGGLGVSRGRINVTDRSGDSAVVDLSSALTVSDVLAAINTTAGIRVQASVQGDSIVLKDLTGSIVSNLSVQEVGAGTTASELGLVGSIAGSTLTGADVVKLSGSLQLSFLNDLNGVRTAPSVVDFRITLKNGSSFDVDLGSAATLADALAAINAHAQNGGKVTAAIAAGGDRLLLTDSTGGTGTLTVSSLNQSQAAADLGILGTEQAGGVLTGRRILAGLDTVLLRNLNGGAGITTPGQVQLTARNGASATVNLTAAETLSDVIVTINAAGLGLAASVNASGNGLLISDTTGSTVSNLIVTDTSGTTAADLKIAVNAAVTSKNSGDLNLRYISENTRLDRLNGGAGLVRGQFRVQDSSGAAGIIDLTGTDKQTIGDVLVALNTAGIGVTARINNTGDGILLENTAGGAGQLIVTELGGTTAASLRLLGSGGTQVDGAFRYQAVLDADDTLDDLVDKLAASGAPVSVSIVNDGSSIQPYRLLITSARSGEAGRVLVDSGASGLSLSTLNAAADAVLELGTSVGAGVLLASASNTFADLFPGLNVTVGSTSATPVTISVVQDTSALAMAVEQFVANFNTVASAIASLTSFDPETGVRGVLQGDRTVLRIREDLFGIVTGQGGTATNSIRNFSQLGISLKDGQLSLDATVLEARLASEPASVQDFLKAADVGAARRLKGVLEGFTQIGDGVIAQRVETINGQIDDLEERSSFLSERLDRKRELLLAQFLSMEKALARIQSQTSVLTQLTQIAQVVTLGDNTRR